MEKKREYKLTEKELEAYHLGLVWLTKLHQTFPCYRHNGYSKGDPRKSLLFKYMWKLLRETAGLVEDYNLYIQAQLDILKAIRIGNLTPNITPSCLVGDKAWVRWKVWKKKFKAQTENANLEDVGLDKTDEDKIVKELQATKKFLEGRFGGSYGEPQIMMAKYDMERWVALEKVSPFYVLLSPWAQKYCNFKNVFDEELYKASITPGIKTKFKELFVHEL